MTVCEKTLFCDGICKDGSSCKYKSKMTDLNGKNFCCLHVGQGSLENCSICMEDLCKKAVTLTKCKHVFHTKCLNHWTTNFNTNCPLCRFIESLVKQNSSNPNQRKMLT